MVDPPAPRCVLVKGPDRELRTRDIEATVARLLGSDDRTLGLAEMFLPPSRGRGGEEAGTEARQTAVASALDGARTPPFGTEKRVVVIRTDEAFLAGEAALLAAYLGDPEPTTVLVLESVGRVPADLAKAAKVAKAEEVGGVPGRDATTAVLKDQTARAGVRLDARATAFVAERLGEDVGRVPAIIDLLASAYGEGATLTTADVEPYLGGEGGVAVFELTKAIDAGDVPATLATLHRMRTGMDMHPLQVMAILHNHFRRILRLDDPSVRGEGDAVAALGGKVHAYPAKLAWQRAQRLGTDGIRKAFRLLARADRDLRGGTGAPEDVVLAVAVTELARLGGASPARAPSRAARR